MLNSVFITFFVGTPEASEKDRTVQGSEIETLPLRGAVLTFFPVRTKVRLPRRETIPSSSSPDRGRLLRSLSREARVPASESSPSPSAAPFLLRRSREDVFE